MKHEQLKAMIANLMREMVEKHPELTDRLNDNAYLLLVETELREWEKSCYTKGKAVTKHIPEPLVKKVIEMLGYTRTDEDIKTVFDDVVAFFKQDADKPRWWHERIKPYTGDRPYVYEPGDTEITQEDIDEALKEWDKTMPDYKGMLDANVETDD
jgi:hypothetical protein